MTEPKDYPAFIHPNQDPFLQMNAWVDDAKRSCANYSYMCLSTSTADGKPSSRIVGMLSMSKSGVHFFTCKSGMKAQQIKENPHASLLFYWDALNRQVRLEGSVRMLTQDDFDMEPYYDAMTREQRLTLLLGNQDRPVSSRDEMLRMREELRVKYPDGSPLPYPPDHASYLLVPDKFIFFQGHEDWLSDRYEYTKQPDNSWRMQRLIPY